MNIFMDKSPCLVLYIQIAGTCWPGFSGPGGNLLPKEKEKESKGKGKGKERERESK